MYILIGPRFTHNILNFLTKTSLHITASMYLNYIIVRILRKDPAKIIGDLINLNHREETVHLGVPYLMQILIKSSLRPLRKKPLQAKAPMGGVCNQFYVHQ